MARLPTLGETPWKDILDDFLRTEHNADGTHAAIPAVTAIDARVTVLEDGGEIPSAVGDGVADDRAAIQAYLDSKAGGIAYIPAGTYAVTPTTVGSGFSDSLGALVIPSNTTIILHPIAIIQAKSGTTWNQRGILEIKEKTGVKIYGGTIDGNKAGVSGGGILNVMIYDSSKILIDGVTSKNAPGSSAAGALAGDGFYLGGTSGLGGAVDVTIQNCIADANVRQGLSIVRASNFKILNSKFINTSGSDPGAGIDMEANAGGRVTDGLISGNYIAGNNRGIDMTANADADRPYRVTIENNTILNNRTQAIVFSGFDNKFIGNTIRQTVNPTTGSYLFEYYVNERGVVTGNHLDGGADTTFTNESALVRISQNTKDGIFNDNALRGSRGHAIYVQGGAASTIKNMDLSHNRFYNIGTLTTNTAAGIFVTANSGVIPNFTVRDNLFSDTRTLLERTQYGVQFDSMTAADIATWNVRDNIPVNLRTALYNGVPAGSTTNGNAVLVGGTVTVAAVRAVTASIIILTRKTAGGTLGNLTYTIDTGVGFTINSVEAGDTSTVSWQIVNNP